MDDSGESSTHTHGESLLRKYNIPVNFLDFEYVKKCTSGGDLEKILHILQSGQEGYFPALMQCTEERLAQVKPNSKYIRKATPVLDKRALEEGENKRLAEELHAWLQDAARTSEELETARKRSGSANHPSVRKSVIPTGEEQGKKEQRIKATDYTSWDKYDPDTEILKMDLEAEKTKARIEAESRKRVRAVKFSEFATKAEADFEANRERAKGNEFFKAAEYAQAITCYTNSINYSPSASNYNNRAIARIKLDDYADAAKDCIAALKYEPANVKALLRLVQCHEALGEYAQGLEVAENVIKINPNDTTAQNFINTLNNKLNKKTTANRTRMKIVEIEETAQRVTVSNKYGNTDAPVPDSQVGKLEKDNSKLTANSEQNRHTGISSGSNKTTPDSTKTPTRSILKRKHVMLSIPGTSAMPPPYFVVVENKHPEIIKKQEYILNNRPQLICLNNIDTSDDDNDCLEIHIGKPRTHEKPKKGISIVCDSPNFAAGDGQKVQRSAEVKKCFGALNKDVKKYLSNSTLFPAKQQSTYEECDVTQHSIDSDNNNESIRKQTFIAAENGKQYNTSVSEEGKYIADENRKLYKTSVPEKTNEILNYCNNNEETDLNKAFICSQLDDIQRESSDEENINNDTNSTSSNVEDSENTNKIVVKSCETQERNETSIIPSDTNGLIEDVNAQSVTIQARNKTSNGENSGQALIKNNATVSSQNGEENGCDILDSTSLNQIDECKNNNYFASRKWNARERNKTARQNNNETSHQEMNGNLMINRVNVDQNEPHILKPAIINVDELHVPYSFLKMWTSIGHDTSFSKHAEVLRNLDYNRLNQVIGYKLDGTMLSTIVSTLHSHFMVPHEIERVWNLLNNLPRIQRFQIVSMFLSVNDKRHVRSLFEFLQQHDKPLPAEITSLYS